MALSESGLLAQGIYPGPMIYGPKGHQVTVRPKHGPARSGHKASGRKVNYYVTPKSKGKGRR